MDWAWAAPEPVEAVSKAAARRSATPSEHGDDWIYGLFAPDGSELVGGAGLHRRVGPEALEIGYWIRASRVRQGPRDRGGRGADAARVRALRRRPVEIHVDPANTASLAVADRLGYVREATLRKRLPPIRPGEPQAGRGRVLAARRGVRGLAGRGRLAVSGLAWRTRSAAQPSSSTPARVREAGELGRSEAR